MGIVRFGSDMHDIPFSERLFGDEENEGETLDSALCSDVQTE